MQTQTAAATACAVPPFHVEPGILRLDGPAPCKAAPATSSVVPGDFGLGPNPRPLGSIRPSRNWVPEVVRSEKLPGGITITTTALETAGLTMVLCDPVYAVVVPYAHVLDYRETADDGFVVEGRHRPQVVARRRDGTVIAYSFLHSWERDAQPERTEIAVRAAYRRLGVGFRVLTEHTLFARTVRENRGRLLRERAGFQDPDVVRVQEALVQHGLPTTVARFHRGARPFPARRLDRTLACLIELALAGTVALDLRKPLGPETRVTQRERA